MVSFASRAFLVAGKEKGKRLEEKGKKRKREQGTGKGWPLLSPKFVESNCLAQFRSHHTKRSFYYFYLPYLSSTLPFYPHLPLCLHTVFKPYHPGLMLLWLVSDAFSIHRWYAYEPTNRGSLICVTQDEIPPNIDRFRIFHTTGSFRCEELFLCTPWKQLIKEVLPVHQNNPSLPFYIIYPPHCQISENTSGDDVQDIQHVDTTVILQIQTRPFCHVLSSPLQGIKCLIWYYRVQFSEWGLYCIALMHHVSCLLLSSSL